MPKLYSSNHILKILFANGFLFVSQKEVILNLENKVIQVLQ